jgi:hypothetical protein
VSNDRASFGYGPGELPPGPPGRLIADAGATGYVGYLNERDAWMAEIERRAAARGTRRRILLDMTDTEYEAWKAAQ